MTLDATLQELKNGFLVSLTEEGMNQNYHETVNYVFLDRDDATDFIVNYFKGV